MKYTMLKHFSVRLWLNCWRKHHITLIKSCRSKPLKCPTLPDDMKLLEKINIIFVNINRLPVRFYNCFFPPATPS